MTDLSFGIPLSDVVHDHERLFIEDYMRGYRAMNTDDKGKCIRKTEQMKVGFTAAKGQNYKFSFPRNNRLEERKVSHDELASLIGEGNYSGEYDLSLEIYFYMNLGVYYLKQKGLLDGKINVVNQDPFMFTY